MDPTIPHQRKRTFKNKLKNVIEKITKLIWTILLIAIAVEVIMIVAGLFAKPPNERMCWDRWTCFNYCEQAKQKICVVPENLQLYPGTEAWKQLLTGKRNLFEILNDNQKYCACETFEDG